MITIDELKFDEKGLIPAIVVDADSDKVLTLAYMNKESLEISLKEGITCFWSRSRRELWRRRCSGGQGPQGRTGLPPGDRLLLHAAHAGESFRRRQIPGERPV